MTEDVVRFIGSSERDDQEQAPQLPRPTGWHLCDDDLSVIDALHAICVNCLAYARNAKSAGNVATMMEALEAIASGAQPHVNVELNISRKPEGSDGLSVTIQLSRHLISLSSVEWVWMSPEQGHDHAWTLRAALTSRGGFPYDDVDYWFHLSEFALDGEMTELISSCSRIEGGRDAD